MEPGGWHELCKPLAWLRSVRWRLMEDSSYTLLVSPVLILMSRNLDGL